MNPQWLKSCLCTQAQLESPAFQDWLKKIKHPPVLHRKVWEWCFIAQALSERGLLLPGKRGLGFAVGKEPLSALFAAHGCTIVASDQAPEQAAEAGWQKTGEHATGLAALVRPDICPPEAFYPRVSFRVVDMNHIPPDLTGFDFVWSSCSFEHLGDITRGLRFLDNMLKCLRPGGVAVHTTEFNVSSNDATVTEGDSVLFRRQDFERVAGQLRSEGHHMELLFDPGSRPADQIVDRPPYNHNPHLKLELHGYVSTSMGLIITRSAERPFLSAVVRPLLRPIRAASGRMRRWFARRVRRSA